MNMIAIRIVCLLLCECFFFVIVNSQPTVDESSGQCPWNNEENVLQTFQQTCGPTQQLLHRHEQLLKQVSAQLMTTKCSQSNTTENGGDEKGGSTQQLLMEVKRSCENMSGSSPEQQYTHQLLMQMKQSVDNISTELMTSKRPPSNTTERDVDEKVGSTQQLLMEVKRSCDNVSGSAEHQHTHQLLMQMKQSVDNISADLMTSKRPQSNTTERDVDEKGGSIPQLLMEVKRNCNVSGSAEHQYTHQLLMQMKRSVDSVSAQLTTSKCPPSNTTETVMDEKQLLVSSLTGKSSIHWLTHHSR